jgi:NADH dehydrogenase
MNVNHRKQHVVILGGGFGGLYAAQALGKSDFDVTIVDKRNFHLFQPLLYQVATGGLSPGDIASPIRAILSKYKNIKVIEAEACDLIPDQKKLILRDGELRFDSLIVATGVSHHYFGNDEWESFAPGLKTVEQALDIRRRVLLAFEAAERETDEARRKAWMRFVIVGGGPTGVELAGALGELANESMRSDFSNIDPSQAEILLVEGQERILPTYPPQLSKKAQSELQREGVTTRTGTFVTGIDQWGVKLKQGDQNEEIPTRTVLWGAGVKASPFGKVLADRTGAALDREGRVIVEPDCSIPNYPEIFVIGDLANFSHQSDEPLPGVAQAAMQQGRYVAKLLRFPQEARSNNPFRYKDKGSLAVIGRNAAVADFGFLRLSGFLAWLVWVFVHIAFLIEFDNKLIVMVQWAGDYFSRKRGARLITGGDPFPLVGNPTDQRVSECKDVQPVN